MTDVELLPLPEPFVSDLMHGDLYTPEQVRAYARSNIESLQAEIEALRAEVAEWKRVAVAQAELHGDSEDRAERLAEAMEDIRSRSSINLAMHPNQFELTARLGDIYQIADAVLSKENSND